MGEGLAGVRRVLGLTWRTGELGLTKAKGRWAVHQRVSVRARAIVRTAAGRPVGRVGSDRTMPGVPGRIRLSRQSRAAATVALLAVVAVGCGGGGDASDGAGPGPGDPNTTTTVEAVPGAPSGQLPPGSGTCRLVSESEVTSAIGAPVKGIGAGSKGDGQVCTFALSAQTNPPQTVLVVTATNDQGPAAFDSARKGAGAAAQTVTGIGDRAYSTGGQLVALKGRTVLVIVVGLEQPASSLNQSARKLAETVVGRI